MKPIVWLGDSLRRMRAFPARARRLAGYQLERVQAGAEPLDWKPMTAVGPGVYEIRVSAEGAYRVFYLARLAEAVYVLHAFQKKSQQTSKLDIALGRERFKSLMRERKEK